MEDLSKIKDRIAKLLAMADDSSSPEEAAIAAKRARALMDKYQMDRFDVEGRLTEEFGEERATRFFASMPMYLQFLATSIARYNDCQAVFTRGLVDFKKKRVSEMQVGNAIVFRGYKSDVELAANMYRKLTETVDMLCKNYLKDKGYEKYPVRIGGQFKLGAIMVIGERIREMLKERDALMNEAAKTGTSLMVLKTAGVVAKYGEVKTKTVNIGNGDRDDEEADARRAGYDEGRKVEIVRSVGDESKGESSGALRLSQ